MDPGKCTARCKPEQKINETTIFAARNYDGHKLQQAIPE